MATKISSFSLTRSDDHSSSTSDDNDIVILFDTEDDFLPIVFNGTKISKLIYNGVAIEHLIYNGQQLYWYGNHNKNN